MRKVLLILITLLGSLKCFAQYPVHDKQKENQIRSMEQGHWDFSPDWWYYLFHKKYSGASQRWEWHGFKSGWRVHFDESRHLHVLQEPFINSKDMLWMFLVIGLKAERKVWQRLLTSRLQH